jgi:hypothetical protein
MEPLAQKALAAVENGDLKIIPERFEKVTITINNFGCHLCETFNRCNISFSGSTFHIV